MQIRNDYPTYQSHSYEQSHPHNLTECMLEDQPKKKAGEAGNAVENSSFQRQQQRQDAIEFSNMMQTEKKATGSKKRGLSLAKGFWDSLGEEGDKNRTDRSFSLKENVFSNLREMLHGAQMTIQNVFQEKVLHKLTRIPSAIKTEIQTALKRFGKGKEAFAALADEKMPSGQKNAYSREDKSKGQVTTKQRQKEIPMEELSDNHLMDSYSKTGAYCRINENLTYQKPKTDRKE